MDRLFNLYNKPLVMTVFAMLRQGIACQVEGRDIGKNLITLATKWKVKSLEMLDYISTGKWKKPTLLAMSARLIARCREKGQHDIECVVAEITRLFG
jgi:hypothetical protein